MTEASPSNALKHGAFSEVLILPGEDPAAYEKLKKACLRTTMFQDVLRNRR